MSRGAERSKFQGKGLEKRLFRVLGFRLPFLKPVPIGGRLLGMRKRAVVIVLGLLVAAVALAATAQAGHKTTKVTNVTFAGWSSGPDEDALDQQMANAFNADAQEHPRLVDGHQRQLPTGDDGEVRRPQFAGRVLCRLERRIGSWEKQGVVQPLNSYMAKSKYNTKAFYPKPARRLQDGQHDLRLPEGLVAARDGGQHQHAARRRKRRCQRRGRSSSPSPRR